MINELIKITIPGYMSPILIDRDEIDVLLEVLKTTQRNQRIPDPIVIDDPKISVSVDTSIKVVTSHGLTYLSKDGLGLLIKELEEYK